MDLHNRQICLWVITNQVGLKSATIREHYLNLSGVMHNMAVRQNKAI
jgi:hypothetical protein